MNVVEGFALLLTIPAVLLLSGFWLAAPLRSLGPSARLAVGLLAGLCVGLFFVSVVNFFRPLASLWTVAGLLPGLVTVLLPPVRRQLVSDLAELGRTRRKEMGVALLGTLLIFGAIFWPALRNPELIFWEGTSNHDSFFWITGAEYLKHFTYADYAGNDSAHPVWNHINAMIGMRPPWGRMGSEGLLAIISVATGLSALKVYVWAAAALFWLWIAAAYLLFRTFLADRVGPAVTAALVTLQPLFVFSFSNSNLPNLLGILCAALLLVAAARVLRVADSVGENGAWGAVVALSFHGLMCSYPELLPFALAPCGLLVLRSAFEKRWTQLGWLAGALVLGCVLNGVSTLRAWNGFLASFETARANENWGSLLGPISPAQYLPALLTLCVPAASWIGPYVGLALSLLCAATLVIVVVRAHDRFGLLASLAGAAALLVYTIATDFNYGWQKTAQFGGVVLGVIIPTGGLAALLACRTIARRAWLRHGLAGAALVLGTYGGIATGWNISRMWYWADTDRKGLERETADLRRAPLPVLHGGRILIVSESFFATFYHGMWATYFLPDAELVFSPRDPEPGGYLRHTISVLSPGDSRPVDAIYVSRRWADTIDANSPRLLAGNTFALLRHTNRILAMDGFFPGRGVPDTAAVKAGLTIQPVRDSQLTFELNPVSHEPVEPATIDVQVSLPDADETVFSSRTTTPPPWEVVVPLRAGVENRVAIKVIPKTPFSRPYPLRIDRILVKDRP